MAIWQESFTILLSDKTLLTEEISKQITDVLPLESNKDQCLHFGNYESNDVFVFTDETGKIIEEIEFRIDLRNNAEKFIDTMLEMAAKNNLLLSSQEGIILSPTKLQLFEALKKSRAHAFLTNPEEYLNSLGDDENE